MLDIAVVEDDRSAADIIVSHLKRYGEEFGEAFNIKRYENGIRFLSSFKTDLDIIFMDVDMPDMDGFEVAENLRAADSTVALVFVTNLAQYAVRGYEFGAMDYILKPVGYAAFALKLRKVINYCKKVRANDRLITVANGEKRFSAASLIYVESRGHHITYHTTEGDFPEYGTMKKVEQQLPGREFFRCNSCYIVNLRYVTDVDGLKVTVGGNELVVSHPRKKVSWKLSTDITEISRGGGNRMAEKLLGKFSYIAAVFAAAVLVAWKMPKRRMFALRAVLSLSLMFVLSFLYDEVINVLEVTGRVRGMLRTVNGFCVFLFASAAVKYCFECNLWAALFAGTAGYSMQHISRRLYDIAVMTTDVLPDIYAETAILAVWTPVVYIVTWLIGIRKHAYDGVMTDNKLQIIIALCVVIVSVFLNSYAKRIADAGGVEELGIYIYLFSVIISALSLLVEFMMLSRKRAETERDVMKQLMSQEREQFALEKTVVETINIKCHDLKHQLSALESKLDTSELEKIRSAVDIYDSSFKTGNLALDVVLSMKSLLCERKNIKLTCMADGMALSFMSDTDIYSLFGNILDNAIEAVEGLDDEERRVICITISRRNGMVFIHEENYFSKRPRFKGGLPQTTKEDKAYHGYGMLSISVITEQYGGDRVVGVDGGVFYLDIMFPQKGTV